MNGLFQRLIKTSVPVINAQLLNSTPKPHFSVFTSGINSSFYTSSESYVRPSLSEFKQVGGESKPAKSLKTIKFRNKIEQHDFQSKLNNIMKWLKKGHQVKAVIQNYNDLEKSENIFDILTKELAGKGVLEEKSVNQRDLRFTISPLVEVATKENKETQQ